MANYISALEISDTQIRLAVGFVKDKKVQLIHVADRPIHGLVSRGEIIDFQTVSSIIGSMKEFKDQITKEKFQIGEVTLVLPSLGLNVFQNSKTSNVVSSSSMIDKIDIENVINLVEKEVIPQGSVIVDIIPDSFVLEGGRSYVYPPIKEQSNNITIRAKIQTLPARTVQDYNRVVEGAHLKVRRMCVSSYAISELARYDEEMPSSYILVDIGADITNVSLIGNHAPFETISFMSGASDLINKISTKFGLAYDDSFELLKKFGLDERPLAYKPVVATSFVDGIETKHDPESLNNIIKEFFQEYFSKFDVAYETLMKGYQDNVRNLPVVFCGGLTKMFGFEGLMKEKFASNASLHYLEPHCVGARDTSYSALIGALYASSKYKGTLSDTRQKSGQLNRVKNDNE